MASPARKLKPQPALAQPSLRPRNIQATINNIAQELKTLRPVNFTLTTTTNPYSLPESFGQILHQEDLLDISGNKNTQNIVKLHNQEFLQKLIAKLTYSLVRSQFLQQIFATNLATAKLIQLPKPYSIHYQAFSRLMAEHYSYFPANIYIELHYPQLFTLNPTLNRYPVDLAVKQAQEKLLQVLNSDKERLIHNLQAYLEAAAIQQTKTSELLNLNRKIVNQILTLIDTTSLEMNDFVVLINKKVFPQIAVQYIFPQKL